MNTKSWKVLIALCILVFLALVKWIADPARSRALLSPALPAKVATVMQAIPAIVPAAPAVSIVFLLDSSTNMQPRIGRDYFELARDGVARFLDLPGFPDDGTFEIAVLQYAKKDAPGYVKGQPGFDGAYHWFGPLRIVKAADMEDPSCESSVENAICATKDQVIELTNGLEHTKHYTGMLLESGLYEARSVVSAAPSNAATAFHVILLGTGEYRLPKPWPPELYCVHPNAQGDCPAVIEGDCDDSAYGLCTTGCTGIRACHVRYHANQLRIARGGHVYLSAVHLGPNFNNYFNAGGFGSEQSDPYGATDDYCTLPAPGAPPAEGLATDAWKQPDRIGLLKELINWRNESSVAGSDSNPTQKCHESQRLGKYTRIIPDTLFGDFGLPGGPLEIAKTIASWLCEWHGDQDTRDGNTQYGPDGDIPLCDNCPDHYNPRQRDCNLDGIGDICQQNPEYCCDPNDTAAECEDNMADEDKDGLCNGLDQCKGGDDCLVRYWATPPECYNGDEESCACNLEQCGCDCDNNATGDSCDAAKRFLAESTHPDHSLDDPAAPHAADNFDDPPDVDDPPDGTPQDGIPDCAQGLHPTCKPIPEDCDLRGDLECELYAESFPYGTALEAFKDALGNQDAAEWLESKGWSLSPSSLGPNLEIDPDANTENAIECTVCQLANCCNTCTGRSSECPSRWACSIDGGQGVLEIGGSEVEPLPTQWTIQTKGYTFSNTDCGRGQRFAINSGCISANCEHAGEWSFVAVDIELNIENNPLPNLPAEIYRAYDLVITDGCGVGPQNYERLRLRFADKSNNTQNGDILYASRDHNQSIAWTDIGDYSQGVWFRLRIVFDNSSAFDIIGESCHAIAGRVPDTVQVFRQRNAQSFECFIDKYGPLDETDLYALPPRKSGNIPGIRVAIEGSNEGGLPLWIGAIAIRPTDGCEFDKFGSGGGTTINWPCQLSGSACGCSSGGAWECQAQECPANDWYDCTD